MLTELIDQFDTSFEDFPARVFPTTAVARLEISHRVILDRLPSRLKLPVQTIVVLIGWGDGVRH
jgi:hypothetical protein